MSLSATAKWVLLALAGLAIAIAIAIAAANLTSRQIGIASESVSAGDALAPTLTVPADGKPKPRGEDGKPPATTTEEPPSEETTTPDDHGNGDPDSDDD
jgi:hypothetical protein